MISKPRTIANSPVSGMGCNHHTIIDVFHAFQYGGLKNGVDMNWYCLDRKDLSGLCQLIDFTYILSCVTKPFTWKARHTLCNLQTSTEAI